MFKNIKDDFLTALSFEDIHPIRSKSTSKAAAQIFGS